MQQCDTCGIVDDYYDEDSHMTHHASAKHQYNKILKEYSYKKKEFSRNREGIEVLASHPNTVDTDIYKLQIFVKPNEKVKVDFKIRNQSKENIIIVGVELAHPQPQFILNNQDMNFGNSKPFILQSKTLEPKTVYVEFSAPDIGQFEMPIVFVFMKLSDEKPITIIVRELMMMVAFDQISVSGFRNPFTKKDWEKAETFKHCITHVSFQDTYRIPKHLKTLFPVGLDEDVLEKLKRSTEEKLKLRQLLIETRAIFDEGLTEANYIIFWHYLLWWEEAIARINLRKFNMSEVTLQRVTNTTQAEPMYSLQVPGLAEKRPSLLRGDKVFVRPCLNMSIIFESVIKNIENNEIHISGLDNKFLENYTPDATFNIRFIMSRVVMERMHFAVSKVFESKQSCRVFPKPNKKIPRLESVKRFYNRLIPSNSEQALAVQHIIAGTSGKAPYMLFGPPGTGKTITIVEAILQLVLKDPKNRILVCTDSNMAADHIACTILQYKKVFEEMHISNFLFRANSQNRVWEVMPKILIPVSNGSKYEDFYSVNNYNLSKYRVVVATLQHAAKYGMPRSQTAHRLMMTHLFIDEAAQAMEPACLIPITGLLAVDGRVILAGDPKQLGPVCMSKAAKGKGLGISLMERLKLDYPTMYNDYNYITMLKKNFRSHPDILELPNELFYDKSLQPAAKLDPLSTTRILGEEGGQRAIVFHGVNSMEQRVGKSPSFYNEKELLMLQRYIKQLIEVHKVETKDIGVIAPYIRQVYKIKAWLMDQNYNDIEVGTVEAFQGKEKRVVLVTTVRANCRLLDYDAKYELGFLVDDKRFNVALTRAKAKAIIIGNPACLSRDVKWRKYMEKCMEHQTYYGQNTEQLKRTEQLLHEISVTRFDRFHITEHFKKAVKSAK